MEAEPGRDGVRRYETSLAEVCARLNHHRARYVLVGASALQLYLRIYLPLLTPALAVVAIYALLLAWNDYLYQILLLNSQSKMTVAMMQGHLFEDPDAAWNAMMAAAIIYSLPPIMMFFALRRYMAAGLTSQSDNAAVMR